MRRAAGHRAAGIWPALLLIAGPLVGQTPVSRAEAVAAALARGGAASVAGADTAAAAAAVAGARVYPDPTLTTTYSKDVPQYHAIVTLPIDLPWIRARRIGAAEQARVAAGLQFRGARAAIRLEADTAYTAAVAALQQVRLSEADAAAADSLLRMTRARERAGDASHLEVALAQVAAGQAANQAAADSLAAEAALLELQRVMGIDSSGVTILPADSLVAPAVPPEDTAGGAITPEVASAQARLAAAEAALAFQRSARFPAPSLEGGVEWHDPEVASSVLPTIGLSFPLPLFDRNRAGVAQAAAGMERARAELRLARQRGAMERSRALRSLRGALARLERDRTVLDAARQVAAMSLTAYAEGASGLPAVLEARRTAREALGHYVDDLAAAANAAALVAYYTAPLEGE